MERLLMCTIVPVRAPPNTHESGTAAGLPLKVVY